MVFSVKYRDSSGAVCERAVEAANRAECYAKCKEQGIVPIGIEVGASSGNPAHVSVSFFTRKSHVLLPVATLTMAGIVFWVTIIQREEKQRGEMHEEHQTETVFPSAPIQTKAAVTVKQTKIVPAIRTTSTAATQTAVDMMKLEGEAITPEQKLYRKRLAAISNQTFKTASDQIIAMAMANQNCAMPPIPIQQLSNKEFIKSLEQPIEISPSDPPHIKRLKEAVLETRAELVKLLAKGYNVSEVLSEHLKLASENYEIRKNAEKDERR